MENTVAAISTPLQEGAIGIVRMTGADSWAIGKKVFRKIDKKEVLEEDNRRMLYGHIFEGDCLVDEVLVCFFKEPNTYTREDMVEIYTHGGPLSVRKVFSLLLKMGAEPADRGEFTKRAFLNGRIDLSQAEAVADLVSARTDSSYKVSLDQLEGSSSSRVNDLRDRLLDVLSTLEYSINFTEDGQEDYDLGVALEESKEIESEMEEILDDSKRGKIIREGIKTLIIGKPNVGKSSLLNALLKENRAIVTDVPGTTRDLIEESLDLNGLELVLMDTAGIRETEDEVEEIGVKRSLDKIGESDLIIAVLDGSSPLEDEDLEILKYTRQRPSIVLLNKMDKGTLIGEGDLEKYVDKSTYIINISAKENEGLNTLEDKIMDIFFGGKLDLEESRAIMNERQTKLLNEAHTSLSRAISDMERGVTADLLEVDFRISWMKLGEILGASVEDDVLDNIFENFCIGK